MEKQERQDDRLLRLPQIIGRKGRGGKPDEKGLVPVSKSSWWAGCKSGRYPAPRKLSERTTVWLESEIMAVVNGTFKAEVSV